MTGRFIGLNLRKHRRLAESHHAGFRHLPGASQIASVFALRVLLAALEERHPRRVLEVGAGIGTMTSLLERNVPDVYFVEDHEWCVGQLAKAVRRATRSIGLGHGLIVVDGTQVPPSVAASPAILNKGGWILVEGNRRPWREDLEFSTKRPYVMANLRPFDRSKGMWVIAFEPTPKTRLAFALERAWQRVLDVTASVWARLTGARVYHGKRNVGVL